MILKGFVLAILFLEGVWLINTGYWNYWSI